MRALGVHIFAGGFSLGVERHFDVLAHLERSDYGVKTWRRYRSDVPVHVSKTASWPVAQHAGNVDLVYGNPPCAAWSPTSVGYVRKTKSKWLDWARDVVRVGQAVGAKVTVVESVRGAMLHGVQFYRSLADEHGLSLAWVVVNARDHGLAQHRPRLFIVYTRGEVFCPEFEALPTPSVLEQVADPWPDDRAADPIGPKSIYAPGHGITPEELLKCVPALKQGKRLWAREVSAEEIRPYSAQVADRISHVRFAGHMLTRTAVDRPCPVVYGLARYVHPTEDRLLTLRELMRLTGYPDDFQFDCDQATALRMLGKSVCPPVAGWLAGEVAAYLRGDRDVLYQREALFDCCSDPPRRGLPPEDGPVVKEADPSHNLTSLAEVAPAQMLEPAPEVKLTKTVTRRRQLSSVAVNPEWENLPGPTALARVLISAGADDDHVLAATRAVFGHRAEGPHLFTRKDLERLRARIAKRGATE